MASFEDDSDKKIPAFALGQDLTLLSRDELAGRIEQLKAEIERMKVELERKTAVQSAAEALFGRF